MRSLSVVLSVMIASFSAFIPPVPVVAQQLVIDSFPVTAVIRGENIRLRADPAEETNDVAILQRGDEITITGESTDADRDEFFPVEVTQTGEVGWVRALFIDPRSVVPIDALPVPAADEEPTRERPARRNRETGDARQPRQKDATVTEVASTSAADALSFSGSTPTVTEPFAVPSGILTVTGTHQGDSNFIVQAYTPSGVDDFLFNVIGPFTGETTLEVDPESMLILDVEANGPWEIIIEPAF